MKINRIPAILAVTSLLWSTALAENQPVLVKAVLSTHTYNDKDNDTGVFVDVKMGDGTGMIAKCANADNSKSNGTAYKKNSDHTINLEIVAAGIKKEACKGFKVHLWQHTGGWETWRLKPSVTLTFSDGTTLVAQSGDVELKNDKGAADFSAH